MKCGGRPLFSLLGVIVWLCGLLPVVSVNASPAAQISRASKPTGAPNVPLELRLAQVQWRAIPGATKYEIELAANNEMDPVTIRQQTTALAVEARLMPGTYFFRVRGRDAQNRPGPWSEVQGFQVHGAPPKPVFPPHLSSFSQRLPSTGMLFQWKFGGDPSPKESPREVVVEIRDASGKVLDRTLRGERLQWMPTRAGMFEWRVGAVTPAGVDWSDPQTFHLKDSALPGSVLAASLFSLDEVGFPEIYENGRERQWNIMPRFGQSLLLWDAGITTPWVSTAAVDSGSNFVAGGSLEIAHRFPRSATQNKLLTMILHGSVLNEIAGSDSFLLPRGYLEIHMTMGHPSFRWGPLVRGGGGMGLVVVPDTLGEVRFSAPFSRGFGAAGLMAAMAVSPRMYVTLTGLARLDVGGRSDVYDITLLPTLGYEGSVAMRWYFTPSLMFDLRIRGQGEFYRWRAVTSGVAPDPNYFGNTFVFVDLGFGVSF